MISEIVTLKPKISIQASREKVWKTMFDDSSYRIWATPFSPNQVNQVWYEGVWEKGEKLNFLTTDGKGEVVGMIVEITDIKKNEFVIVKHVGMVNVTTATTDYFPCEGEGTFEKYYLEELDGGKSTELLVEHDTLTAYKAHMENAWPKALGMLKELSEKV